MLYQTAILLIHDSSPTRPFNRVELKLEVHDTTMSTMKKIKLLLFAVPIFLTISGFLLIDGADLNKV